MPKITRKRRLLAKKASGKEGFRPQASDFRRGGDAVPEA